MRRLPLFPLTLAAGLAVASVAAGQSTVHVSVHGSFDPNGSAADPYDTIVAGLAEMDATGATHLSLHGGTHRGAALLNRPMTIINTSSAPAILGVEPEATTSLEVATFNTHLYGSAVPEDIMDLLASLGIFPPLHWLESERASDIAQIYRSSTADVVAMQEVWEPNFMQSIPISAQYPHVLAGSAIDYDSLGSCIDIPAIGCLSWELNSGLVTMSRVPILSGNQVFFSHETGEDDPFEPLASKGWVRTVVEKDGLRVAIYNLHAQAGPESEPAVRSTRLSQMAQLRNDVIAFRDANPTVPVILTGDFNIRGSGDPASEYTQTLRALFDSTLLPFVDAARSDRTNRSLNGVTSAGANRLNTYWGGDAGDKRLDYVLYAHSQDGTVRLHHEETETVKVRGVPRTHDGISTVERSDHWAVHTRFTVARY